MMTLTHNVKIYVPSTVNVNVAADNAAQVKSVLAKFSAWFGGATAQVAQGAWVASNGELIVESVTIVTAFCSPDDMKLRQGDVIALAIQIGKAMSQEAMSVEINGALNIIETHAAAVAA